MKKAISIVLQTILLLLVDVIGSFMQPFHVIRTVSSAPGTTRIFIWDGILCMVAVYILMLLVAAARKRLPSSAIQSTIALVIAVALSLASKLGFITHTL